MQSRNQREGRNPQRRRSQDVLTRNRRQRKHAVRAGWMEGPARQMTRKELLETPWWMG